MAVSVLVVPEDFRKDQYVLKPIIEGMMRHLGVTAPRVRVCMDPLLGGVGEALKTERILEIVERYKGMTSVFLLIVDRDCNEGRSERLRQLEALASEALDRPDRHFFGEVAWQEVEVWLLAGMQDLPARWSWHEVRAECDPKEHYYDRYAVQRGVLDTPYEGRETLGLEAGRNYPRIRKLCPEDVLNLERRVREALRL